MRDIEFRGKGKESGKWAYGFFVTRNSPASNELYQQHVIVYYIFGTTMECEVDPKTIGQNTGLIDKNGVDIFEGDMLGCVNYRNNLYKRGFVEYKDGAFMLRDKDGCYTPLIALKKEYYIFEIIGNLHDNSAIFNEWILNLDLRIPEVKSE